MKEARTLNPAIFNNLREQVIGRWIDKEAQARGESRWLPGILEQVKRNSPGGTISREGILAPYPAAQERIAFQLKSLRDAGVALTLLTIRALMIAVITDMAPEVYEVQAKDGSCFKCSESFVRKYLRKTLGWSERRATKAAQKLPVNLQEILREAFLREAFLIRDYSIPAALRVNTDQTQLVYQQGSDRTWNLAGEKQVATVGQEEKRAFTLVPSISASGELLPMQAIYMGKTSISCPSPWAAGYDHAQELGFQMLPSMTTTYWSTQETMRTLVDTIIAPYFERKKQELGLPQTQHSIWKIDCWSVHRSRSFREWMKENHPNIILVFVPGGCTSVWQPLDVGIQRVLKLSMRRSAHRDIVHEVSSQIEEGVEHIALDTTLGTLRNRSLQWALNAIADVDNQQLILKSFEMCCVGPDWNLSQASLTSPSALEALRNLPRTNKPFYDELCGLTPSTCSEFPPGSEVEEQPFTDSPEDHSDVPIPVLINTLTGQSPDGFLMSTDGSLERNSMAECEGIGEESPDL
ncbi:hypothetical protein AGABI1DRAFT_129327 [Agaricus bisporus var. burnettii JB137-S8]|uniref:DDE-1 domain-containing protein n=1 Tax=Agaricus bisporus var. burnettii (strain JB137-S8 / ATCC MYA-4627 / FGSC 10392) TaxID=597362 RepID=K5X4V3_AGABU|nr:uncharacterized protein AGABI1DRAFT_129327 [Agaricus bisporus var. burnettii JB137-S8]EKM78198.1 hypothetical protein AGABI1DRAFT_129327 [Agaricus bisporus var. burnettii JB137-S8]